MNRYTIERNEHPFSALNCNPWRVVNENGIGVPGTWAPNRKRAQELCDYLNAQEDDEDENES